MLLLQAASKPLHLDGDMRIVECCDRVAISFEVFGSSGFDSRSLFSRVTISERQLQCLRHV
jgi:hypothetical protein